jgi:hypothetical protein
MESIRASAPVVVFSVLTDFFRSLLDTKIKVLVAMRFFEWYFHEQGRVRGSVMGPEDMQQG